MRRARADYAGMYACFPGPNVDAGVECDLHEQASRSPEER